MGSGSDRRSFIKTVALFGGFLAGGGRLLPAFGADSAAASAPVTTASTPPSAPPASRSALISTLAAAAEFEYTVTCIYLYAASSLKTWDEDGVTSEQQSLVRRWAADIHHIADQEMYHLAQAWNLLTAIGGSPYSLHPNFPQAADFTPVGIPLLLEPLSREALQRYVAFERPGDGGDVDTVAEIYDAIAAGFSGIDEGTLFIGKPGAQADALLSGFSDIAVINNRESALKAIEVIQQQGEGTPEDRSRSHYGVFSRVLSEYEAELAKGAQPQDFAYPCLSSPSTRTRGDYGAAGYSVISDPRTLPVAELFENSYALSLAMLQYVFACQDKEAANAAMLTLVTYQLMGQVLRPLGEQLCRLPSGVPGFNAGPCYGMLRQVALPIDADVSSQLIRERMQELAAAGAQLAPQWSESSRITAACDALANLAGVL